MGFQHANPGDFPSRKRNVETHELATHAPPDVPIGVAHRSHKALGALPIREHPVGLVLTCARIDRRGRRSTLESWARRLAIGRVRLRKLVRVHGPPPPCAGSSSPYRVLGARTPEVDLGLALLPFAPAHLPDAPLEHSNLRCRQGAWMRREHLKRQLFPDRPDRARCQSLEKRLRELPLAIASRPHPAPEHSLPPDVSTARRHAVPPQVALDARSDTP